MDKTKIVSIDPEQELRFFNQTDGQTLKSYLTITNVSTGNLAYKVKTTAPRYYVVKPNQGILDKGQKITIDITLIPSADNKIEDNKFLVQCAPCDLSSSETYQLNAFWEKLEKNKSISFKLKVSTSQTPATSSFSFRNQSPQNQKEAFNSKESLVSQASQYQPAMSFREEPSTSQPEKRGTQNDPQPQSQLQNSIQSAQLGKSSATKHEYEKAPDDEINQSLQSVSQSQNINQDNIKKKTEEVKRQYDLVLGQKIKLQNEINELKNLQFDDSKQQAYDWQQPDNKGDFRFQLIHLLITSIICLFIGGYLGARDQISGSIVSEMANNTNI